MSLKFKTEQAFKGILIDKGITFQILTSQEPQTVAKTGDGRVVIRYLGGPQVTPKARNIRARVVVSVEGKADQDSATDTNDSAAHASRVDLVETALNDIPGGLAAALSAQRAKDGISPFFCAGVVPTGEIGDVPRPEERIFRDSWGYTVTVCESDNS